VQHVRFVKVRGTCGSGERNAKILIDFRIMSQEKYLPLEVKQQTINQSINRLRVMNIRYTTFYFGIYMMFSNILEPVLTLEGDLGEEVAL
jgi:hypothetical protein